ncbi:MAG TPA: glycoside hydrolase family 3 N-terminal domain-containing protein [bacterium]|nr:glycoside hydrolase family 3 N-terminal domain-containing protein [bacterium]
MSRLDRIKRAAGNACVFSLSGPSFTEREERLYRETCPTGVIFFRRNVETVASLESLCGELRRIESLRIVSIDEEGGRVRRLPTGPYSLPPAKALAALDEDEFSDKVRVLGRELRRIGITMDMAPVVDLRSGEDASIVGDRAFSDDPEEVSRHALRYLSALRDEGVFGVIKHFPGHGATTIDSHKELPRIEKSLRDLAAEDLLPYRRLAGTARFVMVAHILVPDADPLFPASLSRQWMRILRRDIGFDGIVMTDDIEMHALDNWSPEEKAALFLASESDLLLICSGKEEIMRAHWEALVRAAEADDAIFARLEQLRDRLEGEFFAIGHR